MIVCLVIEYFVGVVVEVENGGVWCYLQCLFQCGVFFWGKRVMDMVFVFIDGKNVRDIDYEVFFLRVICLGSDFVWVVILVVVCLCVNVI